MRLFGIIFKHCKKNPMLLLPKNLKKKSQIFYQGGLANHKRVATYKMFQLHFTKIHDFVISNARKQQRKSHSKIAIGYCALLPYQWNLWSFHSVWKILQKLLILARKFKYLFNFLSDFQFLRKKKLRKVSKFSKVGPLEISVDARNDIENRFFAHCALLHSPRSWNRCFYWKKRFWEELNSVGTKGRGALLLLHSRIKFCPCPGFTEEEKWSYCG